MFTYLSNQEGALDLERRFSGVKAFACEITDQERSEEIAREVLLEEGGVDILVNNVGVVKDSTFLKMGFQDWSRVIDINLKSLYHFTQAFLPVMVERGWGRIISMSSVIGEKGGFGQTNYAASKAGILGFTKSLALEVAKKGVTVNAVAPGFIETDILRSIPESVLSNNVAQVPE